MSENEKTKIDDKNWPGLSELDRALAEDRLTAYTWKKTWRDPWGRLKLITIFIGLTAFVIYVAIRDGFIQI